MASFKEIQDMVKTQLVIQSPDSNTLAEIKASINRQVKMLTSIVPDAPVLNREVSVVTIPKISTTGTAQPKQNQRLVPFSDTDIGLDRRYIDAFIKFGTDQETYRILDVVVTGTTPTEDTNLRVIIDPPYSASTPASAVDANILQLDYPLPRDVMRIISVRVSNQSPRQLRQIEQSDLELRFPDPIILGQEGEQASFWADTGRTQYDFYSTDLENHFFETEGVVSVTNDSRDIAMGTTVPKLFNFLLSDRVDTSEHQSYTVGKDIIIEGDTRHYPIEEFTHTVTGNSTGDTFNLAEPYKGSTASDVRYVIGQRGLRRIRVYPIPTTALHLNVRYRRLAPDLVDDNDIPELPLEHHHVISLASTAELLLTFGGDTQAEIIKSRQFQDKAQGAIENMFRENNSIEGRPIQLGRSWVTPHRLGRRFVLPHTVTTT